MLSADSIYFILTLTQACVFYIHLHVYTHILTFLLCNTNLPVTGELL